MSARPLHATERAALILQLVPYLLGKGEVSVVEAADEFEVTPDQMRDMVQKLTVIGRPGEGGFWQLPNDLFDIDWDLLDERDLISITHSVGLERAPRLTAREAAALLAGLQLAAAFPGVGDGGVVQSLLAKLARGAASAPADLIVAPGPVDDVRVTVSEALRRGVAVSFTYQAPDAPATTRTVDPAKVHVADGQWYLQGWCHMRQAMRTFHLERVSDLALTDLPVTHGGEPVPELFEPGADDVTARLRYPRQVAPLLGDYLTRAERTVDGDIETAAMPIADEQSLKRVAARLGGDVEVLAPAGARRATAAWAAAGLAQYREAPSTLE
ncbi:WYL domain-containing protein [Microbacterium sp. zg.Y1090]|uniref:helix-turn-helix transcriptional regulator n=1 Tax=Microbacterium TaxID=33882 RepID=UPI00214C0F5A|nr:MULTISPECIES: WYL domain-containing protein [unclassified Microbacterium]MCR2811960.1 WYL domain-containing protein [Microbacterium sp. zg.Y1084]MCR2818601.1 WYL domain-containing protein [Microbacterium sp. zg.Y1090]MDL5486415.1 WYL domain-containing protein [Microbacterium sp. zg-Y1211]WIM29604.1 WYL domain-containing protein [Microbacterium sp. zg-Y1090]